MTLAERIAAVIAYYKSIKKPDGRLWHPRIQATPLERKRIAEILKIYTVADCETAIDGIHVTDHNIGEICPTNPTGKKYLRLGLIFDEERFNGYLETGIDWREKQAAVEDLRLADEAAKRAKAADEQAARAEPRESLAQAFRQNRNN